MKTARPATIRHMYSAGGVVFRFLDAAPQVVLIANKKNTVWTLPKGMIDRGEEREDTAIREIREETGLTGRVVEMLGEKSYWFFLKNENLKCKKTVTYFLVEYVEGNTEDHNWEVDDARWFDLEEAMNTLSYKRDREILKEAGDRIWAKYLAGKSS
ncbi:MAG: NUDIX hydrolase [Nitrospirae bacterium]|nr:MAG: NUDIX hydrolase [Nitrospirota bacterium]